MVVHAPGGPDRPAATRDGRAAVPALCGVQFVDVLGVTVVVTALPAMLRDLHARPSAASLIATGYAVFFGALLMLGARLGDRAGHGLVLQRGLLLFAAASVLGAGAPTVAVLVAARCLQGAAAALSVPPALRLLSAAAPEESARRRAMAAWSATGAAAGGSGLLLGGVLTDLVGWRSLFWLNLPLAALLIFLVRRSAPETARQRSGTLDVPGAILLACAVAALVLAAAIVQTPQHQILSGMLLALSAGASGLLSRVERRAADPLIPAPAVRHPALRTGVFASFANTATTSSVATLATLYLQDARGFGPTLTGLALLPFSLCVVAGAAAAARAMRRLPPRRTAGLGLGVIAVGDSGLLLVPTRLWVLPVAMGVAGFGIGLSSVAATTLGTDVPDALAGTAAGALNTAAQLGTALGVAGVLLVASTTEQAALPLHGTRLGWLTTALGAGAAAGILLRRHRAKSGRDSSPLR